MVARVPAFQEMNIEQAVSMHLKIEPTAKVFKPPSFGVTMLGTSHGFDPHGSTTGMVVWISGRGVMVDPPPNTYLHLRRNHVPARSATLPCSRTGGVCVWCVFLKKGGGVCFFYPMLACCCRHAYRRC